jgi:hypothetical protein
MNAVLAAAILYTDYRKSSILTFLLRPHRFRRHHDDAISGRHDSIDFICGELRRSRLGLSAPLSKNEIPFSFTSFRVL